MSDNLPVRYGVEEGTLPPERVAAMFDRIARPPSGISIPRSILFSALDKIEAKAKKIAAHMMEVADGDVEFGRGKFGVGEIDATAAALAAFASVA